jgi:hypothetical protein
MVPVFLVGGDCLPSPVYLKCSSCGRLNPVYSEVKPGEEHICVFCGYLFNAPAEAVDEVMGDRKSERGKKQRQRAVKPENRNTRKPLL